MCWKNRAKASVKYNTLHTYRYTRVYTICMARTLFENEGYYYCGLELRGEKCMHTFFFCELDDKFCMYRGPKRAYFDIIERQGDTYRSPNN